MEKDKNLLGNKRIENAITKMYGNLTDENLANVLYVIRDRVKENGHLVVAVKPGNNGLELRIVETENGEKWFAAFTSMEEELKKKEEIVSGFTAEISNLLKITLEEPKVCGIIINPWDKAMKLSKELIKLI